MLLKLESIKNKSLKRVLEHGVYIAIVLVLVPAIFYFELFIILPKVVGEGTLTYFIHSVVATFLLLNVVGNLIYGAFTDSSIKGKLIANAVNESNWTSCAVCECLRPPRAWHCDICDICILKRDHHCTFLACCVGYYNQRYFMMLTFYIFVSMLYAFYYNVIFASEFITWNHGLVLVKFILPVASFFIDFGNESIYVFLIVINVLLAAFTGFLFFYHVKNILNAKTVHETRHNMSSLYDRGRLLNLEEAFGSRWYVAWILPFIHSPLPGNGIEWNIDNKHK